jgi:hypothetical protein
MRYWCALAATALWLVTGVLVTVGHADWVPFFGFTGLIVLISIPIPGGKTSA